MKPVAFFLAWLAGTTLLFVYVTWSIVAVTLYQVRMDIVRRELFQYELASHMLDARFENLFRESGDFDGEIRIGVLESQVLNAPPRPSARLDFFERSGLVAVDFVRLLSGKDPLALQADAERLLLLQYAFYMQRKKRYAAALGAYADLERDRAATHPEDRAFLLLHGGYCHALAGNMDEALARLRFVRREYAGTHFAHSAGVLLDFLLNRGGEALRAAGDETLPDERRAEACYRAGQYARAVALLAPREGRLGGRARLIYARSLEESGEVVRAAGVYRAIVQSADSAALRVIANRRLLLLGTFYAAGPEVRAFAEKAAARLGQAEELRLIEKRLKYYERPVILETLRARDATGLTQELRAKVEQNLPATIEDTEQPSVKAAQAVEPDAEPAIAPPPVIPPRPPPAMLVVVLKDGTRRGVQSVEFAGQELLLEGKGGRESLDPSLVESIEGPDRSAAPLELDGIPLSGVRLGVRDGNILVRAAGQ